MCNISFDINYCWYTVAQNRIQTYIMGNCSIMGNTSLKFLMYNAF